MNGIKELVEKIKFDYDCWGMSKRDVVKREEKSILH
jgi:hypothetical protein